MKKIIVIAGDGIGREVTASAVEVLKKVDEKFKIGFEFENRDAGGTAYEKFGEPLPAATLDACKAADAVLFGAPKKLCSVCVKVWDFLQICAPSKFTRRLLTVHR